MDKLMDFLLFAQLLQSFTSYLTLLLRHNHYGPTVNSFSGLFEIVDSGPELSSVVDYLYCDVEIPPLPTSSASLLTSIIHFVVALNPTMCSEIFLTNRFHPFLLAVRRISAFVSTKCAHDLLGVLVRSLICIFFHVLSVVFCGSKIFLRIFESLVASFSHLV